MTEQWQELKETITEMRDSNGTGTQQEVCKFLVNYMDVLEKQMQEPKTGHWIEVIDEIDSLGNKTWHHKCSICGNEKSGWGEYKYCPDCGYRMVDSQESEESK